MRTRPSRAVKPTRNCQFCQRNLPAIDFETRAIALDDVERLHVCARFLVGVAVVVAFGFWDRNNFFFVDQFDDFALDHIDERDNAFDGVGVAVIFDVGAVVADGGDEAAALIQFATEVSGGKRIDLNKFDVGVSETATLDGFAPAGIGLDDVADLEEVLDDDRWLAVGMSFGIVLVPTGDGFGADVDNGLMRDAGFVVEDNGARATFKRLAGLPRKNR